MLTSINLKYTYLKMQIKDVPKNKNLKKFLSKI